MEKKMIYLSIVLPALLAGCTFLENDLPGGKPRLYYERSRGGADSLNNARSPGDETSPGETLDTVVFVSAVRCGPGYDWQRDTAYGCQDARLLLFRNGEEVMSIPAGDVSQVSAAPDMHHIVDGHLYTEYCDYSRTVIGRDGTVLFTFPGRELLKGLLPRGDDVYTLSENLSTGDLVYRKNGEQLLCSAGSEPFGSFDDPSYGQTGALYEDAGAVCFAFKSRTGCQMVRDGSMSAVSGAGVHDVKSFNGKNIVAGTSLLGLNWRDARIWRTDMFYTVCGENYDGVFRAVRSYDFSVTQLPAGQSLIYCSPEAVKTLDKDEMEKASFCFSPRCAALVGNTMLTLCTPRDGSSPYLYDGKRKTVFKGMDGYLTGVTVSISQPSAPPLIPPLR